MKAELQQIVDWLKQTSDDSCVSIWPDGSVTLDILGERTTKTLDEFILAMGIFEINPSKTIKGIFVSSEQHTTASFRVAVLVEQGDKHTARKVARMIKNSEMRQRAFDYIESYVKPVPEPEPVVEPTAEGLLRFPPNGTYDGDPCTCNDQCDKDSCSGHKCKCRACTNLHLDGLDSMDYD